MKEFCLYPTGEHTTLTQDEIKNAIIQKIKMKEIYMKLAKDMENRRGKKQEYQKTR